MDDLVIIPVTDAKTRKRFIEFAGDLYRNFPLAVTPLRVDLKAALDPKSSPFLKDNAHQAFLAARGGRDVGRIMAIENRSHLALHKDGAGHFGFLEFVPDRTVLVILLAAVAGWLKDRGLTKMVGPFSPSINHELGVLVEGTEHQPTYLMNYAPPYYDGALNAAGMVKAIDLFSYIASTAAEDQPPTLLRTLERVRSQGKLRLRRLDTKKYRQEIDLLVDIYNDGWAENWGAVPLSQVEAQSLGTLLRPLIVPEWLTFVEIDGKAMAVVLQMPDLNRAIADLDGRLLPFGWIKVLRRMRTPTVDHSRLLMLGVRRSFQGQAAGPLAALLLLDDSMRVAREHGIKTCEVGWVLETNKAILSVLSKFNVGGRKTFRIYERLL